MDGKACDFFSGKDGDPKGDFGKKYKINNTVCE